MLQEQRLIAQGLHRQGIVRGKQERDSILSKTADARQTLATDDPVPGCVLAAMGGRSRFPAGRAKGRCYVA